MSRNILDNLIRAIRNGEVNLAISIINQLSDQQLSFQDNLPLLEILVNGRIELLEFLFTFRPNYLLPALIQKSYVIPLLVRKGDIETILFLNKLLPTRILQLRYSEGLVRLEEEKREMRVFLLEKIEKIERIESLS